MKHTQDPSVMADNTKDPEREAFDRLHLKTEGPPSFITWSRWNECEKRAAWEAWQARALLADRESRVPSDDAIIELAHKHGLNRCEERERAALIPFARALLSRPSGEVVGTGASELLGYAPKHDDLLKGIRDNLNIMLASARTHSDGDFVSGYTIKTGALHRIIGLLQIAGFPVIVPAAPAAPASPDAEMLDWLELRDVEVRERLRYGSRRVIHALTEGDEEDGVKPSRLREAIRAAMAASKDPQA